MHYILFERETIITYFRNEKIAHEVLTFFFLHVYFLNLFLLPYGSRSYSYYVFVVDRPFDDETIECDL